MPNSHSQTSTQVSNSRRPASPLFRDQAAASLRRRWFGPVQLLVPPSALTAVGIATVAVAMLTVAMAVIEIPDRIRTVGLLVPVDGLLKIRASRAGRVEQLIVRNGDTVVERQVLMRISGSQQAPGREPELTARVESLRRELGLIDAALEQEIDGIGARSNVNRQRILLLKERIAAAKLELGSRDRQVGLSEGRARRIQSLSESNAVAEHLADEVAAAALQATAIRQSTQRLLLDLQDELLVVEQQLASDRALPAILRRQAGIKREAIERQIAASELLSAVEISAPDNGVVSGLAVRVGQEVGAGDILLTLHDPDASLEARLYVRTDKAGMIAAGQRVELQLQAYPHQLYGTRSAIIHYVSAAAVPAREIDSGLSIDGPVFELRASLQESGIRVRGRYWPLPPGTSFTADLVRRRWPLYRWLWRSVSGDSSYS